MLGAQDAPAALEHRAQMLQRLVGAPEGAQRATQLRGGGEGIGVLGAQGGAAQGDRCHGSRPRAFARRLALDGGSLQGPQPPPGGSAALRELIAPRVEPAVLESQGGVGDLQPARGVLQLTPHPAPLAQEQTRDCQGYQGQDGQSVGEGEAARQHRLGH